MAKSYLLFCFSLLLNFAASAQLEGTTESTFQLPTIQDGDYYREDQIYFNISSIRINSIENAFRQDGFSYSYAFGYIRDIPLNQRGSIALAVGLGYEFSRYQLKYFIDPLNITLSENVSSASNLTHALQVPFEFRFRTSTATKYRFWRLYTGFTFSYGIADKIKIKTAVDNFAKSNTDIMSKFQYGPHINVGYGFWNFYLYYGINNIFSDEMQAYQPVFDSTRLKLGFQLFVF